MFNYTKKNAKSGRAKASESNTLPKRRTIALVLASYVANASRLRQRIRRILSPAARTLDSH
jgi:hypothetical protein